MVTRNSPLQKLFSPKSIAVIGASDTPLKWGNRMIVRPLKSGYRGELLPINPKSETICGLPAYKSLKDIKQEVDLAVVTVPAIKVPGVMEECAEKGIKAVVLITAGFTEDLFLQDVYQL